MTSSWALCACAFSRVLLCSMLAVAANDAAAQTTSTDDASTTTTEPVVVVGRRTGDDAGVGMLGRREVLQTPWSVTGYTSALIADQVARNTSEVLANDPAVRVMGATDGNYDNLMIRGFPVTSAAFALNGLFGVLPWNRMSTEAVDQFEVILGPSTAITGASPFGAIGGSINILPKRATNEPITDLTVLYDASGQAGVHADIGRRFGADDAFGVRLNAAYRNGDTAFDHQSEEVGLVVLGLDYRGERLRLSADLGYQNMKTTRGATFSLFIEPGIEVPDPPRQGDNPFPEWSFAESEDKYIVLNGEYDISSNVTAFASIGTRDHNSSILNPFLDLDDNTVMGNLTAYPYYEPYFADTKFSGLAGIRAHFDTGAVGHQLVVGGSLIKFNTGWIDTFFDSYTSNLYNPAQVPAPDISGAPSHASKMLENELYGFSAIDTLSFAEGKFQLTLGARQQTFNIRQVNDSSRNYDQSDLAPLVAALYRITPDVSVYANYTQGLSQGPIAPVGSVNVGEVFSPTETTQYEAGVKATLGRLFTSLALFQITQPTGLIDPVTNLFDMVGEQRNRGAELAFSGNAARNVRLLGGASYINAELTQTEGGALDGNQAPGVPEFTVNLGAEWDLPWVPGLTLSGRVIYTGEQFVDGENTQRIPDWTRLDAGVRYTTMVGKTPVIMRMIVLNVTGESYWASAAAGGLTLGEPRQVRFSVTASF
jgi:iron complex outermembrane receptor protein